ncbi:MAG: type II toxin-antitoxin system HicB family antitoxin [Desulfovibrio sp.]|jgi:hypothetical protein|nr:type II toxin-antitoxin system HicB family antitoxin [Desulfovibrio sp.]
MTYYFAVFIPAREGGYSIAFPDFPEAISQGEDLSECMVMAAAALAYNASPAQSAKSGSGLTAAWEG